MSVLPGLRQRFHEARADLFVELVRPRPGARLLDIGGGDGEFAERITRRVPLEVTVADVEPHHGDALTGRGFASVALDGDGPLPFGDGEFDIVLSNSVIEHVTLPKSRCGVRGRVPEAEWRAGARAAQAAFAREVRRVGRGYFVQTPDRRFPIDPHVLLPFTHYLSHDNACRLVALTDRFWIKSCWGLVDWELFTPDRLATLFPDGAIHLERLLGLPKSIVAYRSAEAIS